MHLAAIPQKQKKLIPGERRIEEKAMNQDVRSPRQTQKLPGEHKIEEPAPSLGRRNPAPINSRPRGLNQILNRQSPIARSSSMTGMRPDGGNLAQKEKHLLAQMIALTRQNPFPHSPIQPRMQQGGSSQKLKKKLPDEQ
jgi:hypothetical protein